MPQERAITIKDIARMVGVTDATVSNVLNGKGRVSPTVRDRVLKTVADVGYTSNSMARGLKTSRSRTLGILTNNLASPVSSGQLSGIDFVARERGYALLIATDDAAPLPYPVAFAGRGVDGIIAMPSSANIPQDLYQQFAEAAAPFAYSYRAADDDPNPTGAVVDQLAGGALAADLFVSIGRTRLAYISPDPSRVVHVERLVGYQRALTRSGVILGDDFVIHGDGIDTPAIAGAVNRLLDLRPLPDAAFASYDYLAIVLLRECRNRGIRVPDDMAIIGFDDVRICDITEPTLTSIAMPLMDCGKIAGRKLIDQLEKVEPDPAEPALVVLPPSLVRRDSA
ncbi:MAG TPA: LacI family DNA-binding transcriptional regulator [Capsulimonadaceae bacterium]|jgi:LacI family transcriptional regulator